MSNTSDVIPHFLYYGNTVAPSGDTLILLSVVVTLHYVFCGVPSGVILILHHECYGA